MHKAMKLLLVPAFGLALGVTTLGAPPQAAAADSAGAERLWKAKCASCHGKDGAGKTEKGQKMKVADMTTAAWQKEVTDEKIIKSMTDGIDTTKDGVKQKMKPVKLTEAEMKSLVAYIRAFKK